MTISGFLRTGFLENPLVGRQLATQLTGVRMGAIFFIVTCVLFVADLITFSAVLLSDRGGVLEGFAGGYLYLINSLVIYALLACLLPIRVSGAIDGPRFDRVFDQLVVTGVSPIQMQIGNASLGFLYALFILLTTLPFQVYAYMLGGVTLASAAMGYGILALYSIVIIAVSLASSVLEREWLATPAVIILFWIGGLCSGGTPSVFAWLTPARFFFLGLVSRSGGRGLPGWYTSDPVLFLTAIPSHAYPYLLWTFILLPCIVWILLGPSHRFLPGLNNFGHVVLPGDRKRRFFRRPRFALNRKVELSFFYENRARWLDGLDYPLRALVGVGFTTFLCGAITGLFFNGVPELHPRGDFWRDERVFAFLCFSAMVIYFALLGLGDPRLKLGWRERIGKWSAPRSWLQSLIALIFIGGYAWLARTILEAGIANASLSQQTIEEYSRGYWQLTASILLFFLNVHVFGKLATRMTGTVKSWRGLVLLSSGAVLLVPFIFMAGIQEGWLPRWLFPWIFITPFSQVLVRESSFKRVLPKSFQVEDSFAWIMAWQWGIFACCVALLALWILASWALRARARRRAAANVATAGASLFCILLLGSPALTQDQEPAEKQLSLEATLTCGFEGQLFEPTAVFYTLVLHNRTGAAIRGEFHLDFGGRFSSPSRPFEAPPGTQLALRWMGSESSQIFAYTSGVQLVIEAPEGRLSLAVQAPQVVSQNGGPEGLAYLVIDDQPRQPLLEREQTWLYTRPFSLPEDHTAYFRASAVFVGTTDLSRWTQKQRMALYDYIRLGGAVIFQGPLDRASLKGAGEWEGLLASATSLRAVRDGVEYQIETFEEAEVLCWLDAVGGGEAIPLLCARPVGQGTVGHLSCDIHRASLDRKVWKELWERMPAGRYPLALPPGEQDDYELRDSASLLAVLAYFAAYSLLVGPAGFFFLRRKSRRRWLPVWMLALPVSFVLLLPALHASFHLRPSLARLTRVAYYGAGARRGVAVARLDIRSSGRQRHSIRLRGATLSASSLGQPDPFMAYQPSSFAILSTIELSEGEGDARSIDLRLNPWGRKEVVLVADVTRDVPLGGKALVNQKTKRLSIQVAGLGATGEKLEGQLAFRLPGDKQPRAVSLAGASFDGGLITLDVSLDAASAAIRDALSGVVITPPAKLGVDLPERPFVILALESDDVGLEVETEDLAFERALDPLEVEAAAAPKNRRGKTTRAEVFQRDGKPYLSFQRALILQELELEIR